MKTDSKRCCFPWWHMIIGLMIVFLFSACAENPITHREGLHLVPGSQLLTLSFKEYDQVLKKSKLSTDQKTIRMVREVGQRIAKGAEAFLEDSGRSELIDNYKWEFNVIQDDKVTNAWCMPGGKVAVYTGILPLTGDETGLAVVLGHEVGHAIADHGNERMSQALIANMGGMALSTALANNPAQTRDLFMNIYGLGANVGFLLPYSRIHESEADHIGLLIMARAGYDPREAVSFWERMSKKEGAAARPPEFLSTHPSSETRIADIKEEMEEALSYYHQKP